MTTAELFAIVKKQPIGIACGVVCLICVGLLYVRSDKIGASQAEFEAKSAESSKILNNVTYSKNLPEQVAEIQALTKELDSRLIRAGQLAVNQQFFYKLEVETGVKLLDIRQNNPPKGAKTIFVGIPFTLSMQGTYKQLLTFLHRLEGGAHFCRFINVSFAKPGGKADTAGDNMTLSLNLELLGVP